MIVSDQRWDLVYEQEEDEEPPRVPIDNCVPKHAEIRFKEPPKRERKRSRLLSSDMGSMFRRGNSIRSKKDIISPNLKSKVNRALRKSITLQGEEVSSLMGLLGQKKPTGAPVVHVIDLKDSQIDEMSEGGGQTQNEINKLREVQAKRDQIL